MPQSTKKDSKMFNDVYDLSIRDTNRDWSKSTVKTAYFDVKTQPVTCYQNPWELAEFIKLYREVAPSTVLELGPYHGGVLYHWLTNASEKTWVAAVDFFDQKLDPLVAGPADWAKWCPKHSRFEFFEGDTRDPKIVQAVSDYFSPRGLDWLFIDANHDYEFVRADFENYGRLVNPGGIIALHDIRPRDMGSYRLFTECQRAGYVTREIVADPEATEAGIGIIYI